MRIRTHTNPLNFIRRESREILGDEFYKNKYIDFEAGFGRGLFLKNYANKYKDRFLVGAEVRKQVFDVVNRELLDENITNAFAIHNAAEICLADLFDDETIDRIFIFHPDPWLKRKYNKRRIVNEKFLELIYKKLKKNGRLYISTDVSELWEYFMKVMNNLDLFSVIENDKFWLEDYNTNWHDFSLKDNRNVFCSTFEKK